MKHPDAIVIGAGIVGASCALSLTNAGLKVLVIDRGAVSSGTTGAGEGNILVSDKDPLGNLDFFGAFVGTGFALFVYILPTVPRKRQILFSFFILVELYAVYLAGPLQAFVDIGIIAIAIAVFWYRDFLPRYNLSLNNKTFFGTLGVVIWLEGIFLMPFIGTFIPVLGNDIQVRIRGQFWLAATRQFISSPLLS